MKPLLIAILLLVSGCESTPDPKEDPAYLAKLPVATQLAIILKVPALFIAVAFVIFAANGVVVTHRNKDDE